MRLVGAGGQVRLDNFYDASGTIAAGGTAQLALAQSPARSYLYIQNNGADTLWVEIGPPRAHATVSNGVVTGISVDNAGFGFSYPPRVLLMGGGAPPTQTLFLGIGQPEAWSPPHPATASAVMTGSAPNQSVASFTINDPGAGYVCAPYVALINDRNDPNGCAIPSSANAGAFRIDAGKYLEWNGTVCPTGPVAIFGPTTSAAYTLKYLD